MLKYTYIVQKGNRDFLSTLSNEIRSLLIAKYNAAGWKGIHDQINEALGE